MKIEVPKKTRFLWQFRAGMVSVLLLAAALSFCFVSLWALIGVGLVFFVSLTVIFWYIPAMIRSCNIEFTDESIKIRRGVVFEVTSIMPYRRLVYMKSFSTPLCAVLGLRGITLKAARGIMILPEITCEDAQNLLSGGGSI